MRAPPPLPFVVLMCWLASLSWGATPPQRAGQPGGAAVSGPRTRPTPVRSLDSPILKALLADVDEISSPGDPGSLAVWGDESVPVVTGKLANARAPIVAAGRLGEGRFVAFAHTDYVSPSEFGRADTRKLVGNAIRWASNREAGQPRVGLVAFPPEAVNDFDVGYALSVVPLSPTDWSERADEVDVYVFGKWGEPTIPQANRLASIVKAGKGVLVAQTGWGWQQTHGGSPMYMHPFSRLLQEAGVSWTGSITEDDKPDRYMARNTPEELLHAGRAFEALLEQHSGKRTMDGPQIEQAVSSVTEAAKQLPDSDEILRPKLERLLVDLRDQLVPTEKRPISSREPLLRILVAYEAMAMMHSPGKASHAHPAAMEFPGRVPTDAPRVTHEFVIDTGMPGWHSLGLYAAPGEPVGYEILEGNPPYRRGAALKLRFGCHRDELWKKDEWKRLPDIAFAFEMDGPVGSNVTPFGGLLYIEVPERTPGGLVRIRLSGAVESPLFMLGSTSAAEWRERVRGLPGPWGEIGTDKVILSVPSCLLRNIDDPTDVLTLWNQVLDAAADLAGWPHERTRPERYVADVDISAGYMHAGYPIMTHLDAAAAMVSVEKMRSGQWGLFHELGHNHQDDAWTFNGTGEVTCNLFALYILETVCHQPPSSGHPAFKEREQTIAAHMARPDGPARYEAFKKSPFLALFMYCQLREAFGWEPFKKVFAEYRAMPKEERPVEDSDKRDQWLIHMSRATGKNLGPFFEEWGVPTSHTAREAVGELPGWMPEGLRGK